MISLGRFPAEPRRIVDRDADLDRIALGSGSFEIDGGDHGVFLDFDGQTRVERSVLRAVSAGIADDPRFADLIIRHIVGVAVDPECGLKLFNDVIEIARKCWIEDTAGESGRDRSI